MTDKPAMIVELKYGKSAGEAIEQIRNREYVKGIEDHYKSISKYSTYALL